MASKTTKTTKKKPAPKAKPRSPGSKGNAKSTANPLAALARGEVIGVALVLLALFTLLSLMTSSRGQITEGWISTLRSLFGVGVWLIPLVSGALGLWFIIRAIERMPNMPWQRPVGFALLFLRSLPAPRCCSPLACANNFQRRAMAAALWARPRPTPLRTRWAHGADGRLSPSWPWWRFSYSPTVSFSTAGMV
ncbi:MAG: hypothetical protein IPK16_19275 [Anaerolineales bacterium]|nr:hypothetical protein [Anaerolineales bacterium]